MNFTPSSRALQSVPFNRVRPLLELPTSIPQKRIPLSKQQEAAFDKIDRLRVDLRNLEESIKQRQQDIIKLASSRETIRKIPVPRNGGVPPEAIHPLLASENAISRMATFYVDNKRPFITHAELDNWLESDPMKRGQIQDTEIIRLQKEYAAKRAEIKSLILDCEEKCGPEQVQDYWHRLIIEKNKSTNAIYSYRVAASVQDQTAHRYYLTYRNS